MDRWIWKCQNSFSLEEAVKTPIKEQWIFFYGKKNNAGDTTKNLALEKNAVEKEEENSQE